MLYSRADAPTTLPCKPRTLTDEITTLPYRYPTEADASITWSDKLTTRKVFRSVGVCKLCRLKCDCACVQRTCVDTSCCGSKGTVTASTPTTLNSTPS
ncbi:Hypothetical predicted protein [Mytilus galloprovincialis]|nr:Hypothetical predicted protein [Mytilus galloprovincialis]